MESRVPGGSVGGSPRDSSYSSEPILDGESSDEKIRFKLAFQEGTWKIRRDGIDTKYEIFVLKVRAADGSLIDFVEQLRRSSGSNEADFHRELLATASKVVDLFEAASRWTGAGKRTHAGVVDAKFTGNILSESFKVTRVKACVDGVQKTEDFSSSRVDREAIRTREIVGDIFARYPQTSIAGTGHLHPVSVPLTTRRGRPDLHIDTRFDSLDRALSPTSTPSSVVALTGYISPGDSEDEDDDATTVVATPRTHRSQGDEEKEEFVLPGALIASTTRNTRVSVLSRASRTLAKGLVDLLPEEEFSVVTKTSLARSAANFTSEYGYSLDKYSLLLTSLPTWVPKVYSNVELISDQSPLAYLELFGCKESSQAKKLFLALDGKTKDGKLDKDQILFWYYFQTALLKSVYDLARKKSPPDRALAPLVRAFESPPFNFQSGSYKIPDVFCIPNPRTATVSAKRKLTSITSAKTQVTQALSSALRGVDLSEALDVVEFRKIWAQNMKGVFGLDDEE